MSRRVRPCRNCSAVLSTDYKGERCPFCLMPMSELMVKAKKRKGMRVRNTYAFNEPYTDKPTARRKERSEVRRDAHRDTSPNHGFEDSHASHPLGRGFPMGVPLREDGETHREAWMRVLRVDRCAYCDDTAPAGTVDHIIPRSSGERGLHTWLNYTGACGSCNGSKGSKPMLLWLAERAGTMPRARGLAAPADH